MWTFLFKLEGGHKYFSTSDGLIGVCDDSGTTPDEAEDGPLYVRMKSAIVIGPGGATILVEDRYGSTTAIMESAHNGLDLANRLGLRVRCKHLEYRLVRVSEDRDPEGEAERLRVGR